MARELALVAAVLSSWGAVSSVSPGESSQGGPREFAMALAQNDVPGGVVVPEEVLARGKPIPPRQTTAASKATFRKNLASGLDLFNASQGTFRATLEASVVHVRSLDEPVEVANALERYAHLKEAVVLPAVEVLMRRVLGAMRGGEPQAIMGSGLLPGPECPLDRPVRLTAGSTTAIDLLDEIARQVPGLVWFVTYNADLPNLDLKAGLLCSDGAYVKAEVHR